MYALAGVGAAMWALGGSNIWPKKAWRRWLWPIVAGIAAVGFGAGYWRAISLALLMAASAHLGYSPERKSDVQIAATGISYGLALWPILWGQWLLMLLTPLSLCCAFYCGMRLSLRWNWIPWKGVELLVGFLQGFWLAWALLRLPSLS